MNRSLRHLVFFSAGALALVTLGCSSTLRVGTVAPRPNINLAKHTQKLALRFGKNVANDYTLDRANGIGPTEVSDWRGSLTTGFRNAFADSYALGGESGDIVLEIQEAELGWAPAAVAGDGYVAAGRAQIRYKARLVNGTSVTPTSGTAESKQAVTSMADAPLAASSAIETMYEEVSEKLLAGKQ
jgi:hypothetical protein